MQPSCYLKSYPLEEAPEDFLLFSQKRGALIRIKKKLWRDLNNGTLPASKKALLDKLGMLVDDQSREKREMLEFFDQLNAANQGLKLMVVLNLDCNFDCIYCYEGAMKGRRYMSQQTADQVIKFVENNYIEGKKELSIDFYGGEPLMSMALIRQIAEAARDYAETRGTAFKFTLVTNGSLFTRRIAEELVDLGLESVKITLDGPAGLHNRSRPYRSGAGSFADIIANIKETWDLVKIAIGGNYERQTFPKFVDLLDYLVETGLTPNRIPVIKFDPVMKQSDTEIALPDYKGGCMSLSEPWLLEANAYLREEILKRGYRTQKIRPVTCMVDIKDVYVIHYNGDLYKCPGFIGQKGFEIGDLKHGSIDYSATHNVGQWKNDQCADCDYLPLCFGGCRYMSFLRDGKIGALDCRKSYLDDALETLVIQDARYASVFAKQ